MNGGCNVMGWDGEEMAWHCGVVLECNGALCAGFFGFVLCFFVLVGFCWVWVLVCGMIYEGG